MADTVLGTASGRSRKYPNFELISTHLQIYRDLTLYIAPTHGFDNLYDALMSHLPSTTSMSPCGGVRRIEDAADYDALIDDGLFAPFRATDQVLWRYPLLVPAEVRGDIFEYLQAQRLDVTRWYPSLQAMARALCPDIAQLPTPHADHFAASILNLPLTQPNNPPERIIEAIQAFRSENRL